MMKVKKLTKAESDWLAEFQRLMDRCPSKRLGCYTIGDADIRIYDKPVFDAYRHANPRDMRDDVLIHGDIGTVLGNIDMPFQVDGVAG
jgi:hypothetical protein